MQLISIKTCNTLPETNIKWSPDELIGIDLNLNLITKELEVLKQLETRVKNSFVDVGWGSEVTQFKGASNEISEIPIISDSGPITTEKITWRADAENFAILSRNVIYIYTRDGDLIHSSAPIHSSCISWNGQTHIASAFKNKVSFIEKCGLIHGGFGVPDDIINISCNEDGNVIAVSTATRIHFYTCSNYHWFISNTIEMEMTTRLEWSDLNVLFCQVIIPNIESKLYYESTL